MTHVLSGQLLVVSDHIVTETKVGKRVCVSRRQAKLRQILKYLLLRSHLLSQKPASKAIVLTVSNYQASRYMKTKPERQQSSDVRELVGRG